MRGKQSVLYNLGILGVGQVVSQLANMAALVYLAGHLGPHWFGVVQVGVAFMAYALIIAEWGMMSLGIREVSRLDDPQQIFVYAREHTGLLALQAAAVLALGAVLLPRLPFFQHAPWVFWLYLGTVLPQIYTQNWIAVGLERMAWVGTSRIVRSLTYALLVFVALPRLEGFKGIAPAYWVPAIFLVAMVASNLVVNVPLARWFGSFIHPRLPHWAEARRRWRETGSIGANIIILRVLFNIDIILLGVLAAPDVAGNYAAAARVMFLLVVAVEVLWAALLPRLSRLAGSSRPRFLAAFNLYFGFVTALLAPVAIGGCLVADDFVALIYRGKFPAAGPIFQVLAVSYSLLALGTFLGNTLLAEDRQRWYFLPLATASFAAVIGIRILTPSHSGLGASWAMATAHGLLLLILLVINVRKFSPPLGLLLLGLVPALVSEVVFLRLVTGAPVVLRIIMAAAIYAALASWPLLRFRATMQPATQER